MGWTNTHRPRGMSDRAYFEQEFPTMLTRHGSIVACATVRSVFYAAVRNADTAPHEPGRTWALVILIKRGGGRYNFWYKELDETCGPGDHDAPAAVLDALSPTEHADARQWRTACRQRLSARAARPPVRRGDAVTFCRPLKFADGSQHTTLTFVERNRFVVGGQLYRLPGWRDRPYTVSGTTPPPAPADPGPGGGARRG